MPPKKNAPLRRGWLLGALMAAASTDGAAPTEFRICPIGADFQAMDYGQTEPQTLRLSAEDAAAIVAEWSARARDMQIDHNHASLDATPADKVPPAAGWIAGIEAREDGLYAVNVTWADGIGEMIERREARYFSPVFLHTKAGDVKALANIALTNDPAMFGLQALVASARETPAAPVRAARDLRRSALAGMSFADIGRAISEALSQRFGYGAWCCEIYDSSAVFEINGHTFEVTYSLVGDSVELGAEATEVKRTYTPVTGGMKMIAVLKALGLPENAPEADALSAVTKTQAAERELLALTAKPTVPEALAAVKGALANVEESGKLATKCAELEAQIESVALASEIKRGQDEGKLVPATIEWAKSLNSKALGAFLEKAPRIISANSPKQPKDEPSALSVAWEEMSVEQRHRLANDNPEAFRAAYAARKNPPRVTR